MEQIDLKNFTLNINIPNPKFIAYQKFPLCNVFFENFIPKPGVIAKRVVDENGIIWDRNYQLFCAVVIHKDNLPYMLRVQVTKGQEGLFIKSNGAWTTTTLEDFKTKLFDLIALVNAKDLFILDVNRSEANDNCEKEKFEEGEMKQVFFTARDNYAANVVLDDKHVIWRAENAAQWCRTANIFYCKDNPVLAQLYVSDYLITSWQYYHNVKGQWINLPEEDFIKAADSYAPWFSDSTNELTEFINSIENYVRLMS